MKFVAALLAVLAIIACASVSEAGRGPGGPGRRPRTTPEPGVPFCGRKFTLDESTTPFQCTKTVAFRSRAATCTTTAADCCPTPRRGSFVLVSGRCCRVNSRTENLTFTIGTAQRGRRTIENACTATLTATPRCIDGETFTGTVCE